MNARRVNAAAGVICASQKQGRTLAAALAAALDAAGMLMSPEMAAELERLRNRVAELEAQRERRRVRLVALQNDASNMRGSLSPNGEARKVPFELGETLTPAVDWLIDRVAELETVRDDVLTLHVKYVDSGHCQHDGELWPCPTAEAVGGAA